MTKRIIHETGPVQMVPASNVKWIAYCHKCGLLRAVDGPHPGGLEHDACNYLAAVQGNVVLPDAPASPQADVVALIEALREMIYEATHLSPQEDDGSHICKIGRETLDNARAARSRFKVEEDDA